MIHNLTVAAGQQSAAASSSLRCTAGWRRPSRARAAAVVLGRNSNGRIEWKTADSGTTYADWQALQLKIAGVDEASDEDD